MTGRIRKPAVLAAVIVLATLLTACNATDYKKATDAFTQGNYEAAAVLFEQLGDYKDSAAQAQESRYLLADGKLAGGQFQEALTGFMALPDYKDAAEKITACKYGLADEKLTAKNYEAARTAFGEIKDYKDSADKISECGYEIAKEELAGEDFEAAMKGFAELGDYRDAKDLLSEATDRVIEKKLPGTYASEPLDLAGLFTEGFVSQFEDGELDPEEYFKDVKLGMTLVLTFDEEKNAFLSVDEEAFRSDIENMKGVLSQALSDYFEATIEKELEAEGIDLDIMLTLFGVEDISDLFTAIMGMSIPELIDEAFAEGFAELDLSEEGTYEVKDGRILINGAEDEGILTYDLETGAVILDTEGEDDPFAPFCPITFTKKN